QVHVQSPRPFHAAAGIGVGSERRWHDGGPCSVWNVRRPAADVDVLRQWCRLAVERHDGYHEPVLFGPLEPRIRHLHGGIPGGQSTSVNLHEDDTVSTQRWL